MKTLISGLLALLVACGFMVDATASTSQAATVGKSIQLSRQSQTNHLAYLAYRCYWSAYYGRRVCGYYHYNGYYGGGYYGRGYYHHGYYHGYHNGYRHGYHHGYHHGAHHRYHHGGHHGGGHHR